MAQGWPRSVNGPHRSKRCSFADYPVGPVVAAVSDCARTWHLVSSGVSTSSRARARHTRPRRCAVHDIAQVVSLDRAGDLKAELVASAWGSRYSSALRRGVRERFGGVVTDEHDFINFFDHFILQQRQSDGRTVLEQFLARGRSHSEPERTLMGSWRDVVDGIFEVHDPDGSVAVVVSLPDSLPHRLPASPGPARHDPPG